MLLGLKTDNPVAELYLYDELGGLIKEETWQADRELAHGLLGRVDAFLHKQGKSVHDLTGLFVFQGPGSFTGLRIGIATINTLAYALEIPLVGARGEDWVASSVVRLCSQEDDRTVLPFYGAEARITAAKK